MSLSTVSTTRRCIAQETFCEFVRVINVTIIIIIILTNLISSHDYKSNKYKNISSRGSSLAGNCKIVPHFIEVSTLGFISSCSDFTRAVNIDAMSAA